MPKAMPAGASEAEEKAREKPAEEKRRPAPSHHNYPLPGVMDFLGAHVGGELAEERWR